MSDSAYNPLKVEKRIYSAWEKSGYFNPDKLPGKRMRPFVISMPPPNVTGELHLGHVEGIAIQDALIRYHRMKGDKALWVPGIDHAGIATQIVVERLIMKEGLDRHKLGREKFLERVWKWKEQYGTSITNQIRALGASCDWSREAFTMDKDRSLAVRTAFKTLFNDGLIYKGEKIISWCPRCASVISDLEVTYVETTGKLYSIKYQLVGSTKYITIATTRPETLLGDTAIAVHPQDPRYKQLIGKKVTVPIVEREIPIIADRAVEKDFGTGAVKVTPAHDPLDFEIGERHKLNSIQIIDKNGKMTKLAGEFYGMSVQDARRVVVERLEKDGHLDSTVNYIHNIAHCDRCGTVIEPLISEQWFMKMDTMARQALRAVKKNTVEIVPSRFIKVYTHWMTHIHDWTLSRQLWWGHQIPVWYCDECGADKPIVEIETPKGCPYCGGKSIHQDPDTLDTWFSSSLWTFSTLGWPRQTRDLKTFHPTQVMETSWDIIFFWVARMIMMSLKLTKQIPFSRVYFHGLVLNKAGEKMSKSKGTGIDPLPMAQKYGTDAIRLSVTMDTSPGQDFRLSEEKIAHYRNFINKVWNIGRFIETQKVRAASSTPESIADAWILSRFAEAQKQVTQNLEKLSIGDAGDTIYSFLWHEFADWYIEVAKIEKHAAFAKYIFLESLKLLHPFAPFITEELWRRLTGNAAKKNMLIIQSWPKAPRTQKAKAKSFTLLQDVITAIRTLRNITQTPHNKELEIRMSGTKTKMIQEYSNVICALTKTKKLQIASRKELRPTISFPGLVLDLQLKADAQTLIHAEVKRLRKTVDRLSTLLANKAFVKKAPASVIAENKAKLRKAEESLKYFSKK